MDFFNDCEIYVTLEPCNHIGKNHLVQTFKILKKPKSNNNMPKRSK